LHIHDLYLGQWQGAGGLPAAAFHFNGLASRTNKHHSFLANFDLAKGAGGAGRKFMYGRERVCRLSLPYVAHFEIFHPGFPSVAVIVK